MPRFIEGQDRQQVTLLPESLDDFIAEDNAVRVVDAFVNELDLQALGFEGTQPADTGRPSYHPAVLLKIYIFGYLTNEVGDRAQLAPMAKAARGAIGTRKLVALADRGYYSAPQIKACHDVGIEAILPKPMTSNAKAEGRFDKSDFIYIARDDEYQCPAGKRAIYRHTTEERGLQIRRYWSSACPRCPMKDRCTPSDYRRIARWEHEAVLAAAQKRLDQRPDSMRVRRRTVEHVFGTLKHWMGSTHFLTRTFDNVRTEMSLHVLAYNLKRVINILGIAKTMKAMQLARS